MISAFSFFWSWDKEEDCWSQHILKVGAVNMYFLIVCLYFQFMASISKVIYVFKSLVWDINRGVLSLIYLGLPHKVFSKRDDERISKS